MKKIFNKRNLVFLLMFLSLMSVALYIDIYTRGLINVDTYGFNTLRCRSLWIGFSISWVLLFILIIYLLPRNKRVKYFIILNVLIDALLVTEVVYVEQLDKYLVFSDLFLAGEGLQYIGTIFSHIHFGLVFEVLVTLAFMILIVLVDKGVSLNADTKRFGKISKHVVCILIMFIILFRVLSYIGLGNAGEANTWQENYNTKNIYNNYTNPNTSMFVSGFYEYHLRIVYKYFYNLITLDKTNLKNQIDEYNLIYGIKNQDNEYTGIFKDKNVIYVMMESIDSWIVDEETMPTLKYLMNTGINFTNRYSPFFNGGQTINSEFALNTGLYSISSKDTIYDIDDVDYNYSLANMLKKNGYKASSFHGNTGSFYNRSNFHKLLGYDNHYSAYDMQSDGKLDSDVNYLTDSLLLANPYYMSLMANGNDGKYLSFYTTYSAHLDYTKENKIYKNIEHTLPVDTYPDEEYVYRTLAHDTDEALKELISYLKSTNQLDNTVLVLATDHYCYGYSDSSYVADKKGVENDRKKLQNTPFVIWANGIEHKDIDTILDTADILPTVLNMLGIDYDPNKYMGTDVFSDNHDDFVWFSDGSYIKSDTCALSNEAILTKTNYNIEKNKNILLTNYYGK